MAQENTHQVSKLFATQHNFESVNQDDQAAMLQAVFFESEIPTLIVSELLGLIAINPAAAHMLPSNATKLSDSLESYFQSVGFVNTEPLLDAVKIALKGAGTSHDLVRTDGKRTHYYRANIFTLKLSPPTVAIQLLDLSEEVDLIQLEQKKRSKAETNDKMKSMFLANMSHEIRTPLNSIIGFAELLIDQDDVGIESREYAQMIQSAGDTLLQLINDIIDISKIEAGQIRITKSLVDVDATLDELVLMMDNQIKIRNKEHIEVVLEKPRHAPGFVLETDPNRFRQIFTNLLTNAIKFVDEGSVKFGYTEVDGDYVQFFVKDTGLGIEREKVPQIFERFARFDSPQGHNREGTGLGLSITRQLVELLGGRIWFDTEYTKGSTFYFTLPVTDATRQKTSEQNKSVGQNRNQQWKGEVFLVVDDVEANYLFFRSMFKHTGAQLIWAKDGFEAMRICRENRDITLVLMDIMMPHLDGFDTAKQIKEFRPKLPIIAQTAFADEHGMTKATQAGCDEYITKPVQHTELVSLINKLI